MRISRVAVYLGLVAAVVLLSRSTRVMAAEGCPTECWIHVYEDADYSENAGHALICGPAELGNLQSVRESDWGDRIDSVRVGSAATVDAWKDENYADTKISFAAGQAYPNLEELGFHDNIDSMKVVCQ